MATDFDCARVPEQPIPRCPGPPGTRAVLGILRGLILTTASSLTLAAALLVPGTRAASAAELSNGGGPVCAQSGPAVWVIIGGTHYWVPDEIELAALAGR